MQFLAQFKWQKAWKVSLRKMLECQSCDSDRQCCPSPSFFSQNLQKRVFASFRDVEGVSFVVVSTEALFDDVFLQLVTNFMESALDIGKDFVGVEIFSKTDGISTRYVGIRTGKRVAVPSQPIEKWRLGSCVRLMTIRIV